jgi:hypothetical protein
MNLLASAQTTIHDVRSRMLHGSTNKTYGFIGPVPPSKAAKDFVVNRDANIALRKSTSDECRSDSESGWIAFGRLAMHRGVGNCGEQAAAAYSLLNQPCEAENVYLDIVEVIPPGHHNFVVLGDPDTFGNYSNDKRYPKSFSDWPAESVICDPWAKIACYAPNYPNEWRAKMSKWSARDMGINYDRPTDALWYNSLDAFDKETAIFRRSLFYASLAARFPAP